MLRIVGNRATACDGTTRREVLRAGGLSLFGTMTLPRLLQAAAEEPGRATARARSIILLNLFGGPSHLDMFDMKPEAPLEVRGEFRPIATSLPGLQICEHMPRIAQWMHKATLIRSVSHGYNSHNPYAVLTGFTGGDDRENYFTKRTDHPGISAVCQYLGIGPRDLPGSVFLPALAGLQPGTSPGRAVRRIPRPAVRSFVRGLRPEVPREVQPGSIVLRPRPALWRAAAALARVAARADHRPLPAANNFARRGRPPARGARTIARARHDGPLSAQGDRALDLEPGTRGLRLSAEPERGPASLRPVVLRHELAGRAQAGRGRRDLRRCDDRITRGRATGIRTKRTSRCSRPSTCPTSMRSARR